MSHLLEFLLSGVLDLGLGLLEGWAGWRFFLPVLTSAALVGLICWWVSNNQVRTVLSAPLLLAGVLTGLIWQVRTRP